jgi:hypothetical protein
VKVYLSAPMTGIKDFNRPAMLAVEKELKRAGFAVVNPAHLPAGKTWSWYVCRAIKDVPRCDVVAQMDGWRDSCGCCIEVQVARRHKIPVVWVTACLVFGGRWNR